MSEIFAVIMAGGSGTRFWPFSRRALPKQFLDLLGNDFSGSGGMLSLTAERLRNLVDREHLLVATGEDYRAPAEAAVPWLGRDHLVCEPVNRDTAPCMALALERVGRLSTTDNPTVVFVPCDHYIACEESYLLDLGLACELAAESGQLVTIGVEPSYPATAYGYLELGERRQVDGRSCYEGRRFVEKPDAATAERFLIEGGYLWNSGIFVGTASSFRQRLAAADPAFERVALDFASCPCLSFDRCVMEQVEAGGFDVVSASFFWDDIGSFGSLAKYWEQAPDGIAKLGVDLVALDSSDCTVAREGGLVALLGVQELLIAEYDGVLLVADRRRDQEIRRLVELVASHGLSEYL